MKRGFLFCFVIMFVGWASLSAQLIDDVRSFISDSLSTPPVTTTLQADSDSLRIVNLQLQLEESKLNEANMRMQFEELRLSHLSGDSLNQELQKKRIDSLRAHTNGVPVVVDDDTLFYLYAKNGGFSAQQRAEMEAMSIDKLGRQMKLKSDSVYLEDSDSGTNLMYGNKVITTITDQDAMWTSTTRKALAEKHKKIVQDKIDKMRREHSLLQWTKRIGLFILVIVCQFFLFKLTIWLYFKLKARIEKLKDTKLKPFKIQNYELLDTDRQVKVIIFLANIGKWIVMALQLLISVPLLFSIFPKTKKFAVVILSYIWNPIKSIASDVVHYIPNLFTIIIITAAVHYLVKLIKYLAGEIQAERLKLGSFYADWAMPTYHIVRFLLYAFLIAMIYPYLPGSKSGVFQGVSVFLGLIVSLGSSTVIGNIIAGMVITYMRSFKIGDQIKLNDTVGNVVEKTPLVIRIRTPKNEMVTIPNSFMMSSQTVNYTNSAKDLGLIIHSEVTIGYDAPWREVHDLLINAALNTPGVQEMPKPFVLQTSLSDFYPVYQVNAYIKDVQKMPRIYSALHQNIQDFFNEAGVEILSPHYSSYRDGNETTIPKDDMRNKYPDSSVLKPTQKKTTNQSAATDSQPAAAPDATNSDTPSDAKSKPSDDKRPPFMEEIKDIIDEDVDKKKEE